MDEGWYPDPNDALGQRYWDGAQWTTHTAPAAGSDVTAESSESWWNGDAEDPSVVSAAVETWAPASTSPGQGAGWYADPQNPYAMRYWDGTQWTEHQSAPSVSYATQSPIPQPMYATVTQPAYAVAVQPAYGVIAPKNPAISLLVSFFIPGVGSMMNGDVGIGVAILLLWLVAVVLSWLLIGIPFAIGFWVWGMIDGYQGAVRWNAKHGIIS